MTEPSMDALNADAIYAAMTWLRSYANSDEGQRDYRRIMEEKGHKVRAMQMIAAGRAVVSFRPKFDVTPEFCESIYPGEVESVEMGIEVGRSIVWGPAGCASHFADLGGAIGQAVQRYIADEAN